MSRWGRRFNEAGAERPGRHLRRSRRGLRRPAPTRPGQNAPEDGAAFRSRRHSDPLLQRGRGRTPRKTSERRPCPCGPGELQRGRGRTPRKTAAACALVTPESVLQRGRGRTPRKTPSITTLEVITPVLQRGRGRTPRKTWTMMGTSRRTRRRFNEAGAERPGRPLRAAPEGREGEASTRPGQNAPEDSS